MKIYIANYLCENDKSQVRSQLGRESKQIAADCLQYVHLIAVVTCNYEIRWLGRQCKVLA